jgi:hypothetical protein
MRSSIKFIPVLASLMSVTHSYADTQVVLNETGLQANGGSTNYYEITIPSGASNLQVNISGGSGDADLYTKFASQPTLNSYDCRPWLAGNNENCNVNAPQEGTYYVGINAYESYTGLSLSASYDLPTSGGGSGGGGTANDSLLVSGISGSAGSQQIFTLDVPSGASNLSFSLGNAAGDADLYVRAGLSPSLSSFDCRSWAIGTNESCDFSTVQAGTYYVLVYGYSQFTNAILTGSYDTDTGGGGGNGGGGSGGGGLVTVTPVVESGLSGGAGSQQFFSVTIPADASNLNVVMSGGSGDADLYLLYGNQPSASNYDCRPWLSGNNESCSVSATQAGTYYIGVLGYSAFSGTSLTVSYDAPDNGGGGSGGGSLAEKLAYIDSYIYDYLPLAQKFHRPFYARQVSMRLMLRALYEASPSIPDNNVVCNNCLGGVYYDDYLLYASWSLLGGYGVVLDYDPRPVIEQMADGLEFAYDYSVDDILSYFEGTYSGSKIAFQPEKDSNGNFLPTPENYQNSWLLRWNNNGGIGGGNSIPGYPRVLIIDGKRVIQETPGGPYFPF